MLAWASVRDRPPSDGSLDRSGVQLVQFPDELGHMGGDAVSKYAELGQRRIVLVGRQGNMPLDPMEWSIRPVVVVWVGGKAGNDNVGFKKQIVV